MDGYIKQEYANGNQASANVLRKACKGSLLWPAMLFAIVVSFSFVSEYYIPTSCKHLFCDDMDLFVRSVVLFEAFLCAKVIV